MPENNNTTSLSTIHILGHYIPYRISQSKRNRRNIVFRVRDGVLNVSAPLGVSKKQIKQAMLAQASWIVERISELENKPVADVQAIIAPGDVILYRGDAYTVQLSWTNQPLLNRAMRPLNVTCNKQEHILTVHLALQNMQKRGIRQAGDSIESRMDAAFDASIKTWLRAEATAIIPARVTVLAERLGVRPTKIIVRSQVSRWGSCSAAGTISMNWRLIKAPPVVLDYVIIHELAHLLELNHSARFWAHVQTWMPDYEQWRTWLKKNGKALFATP